MLDFTLIHGDNLEAAYTYQGPPIQLLLWSTPYPGLRGFKVTPEDYLRDWLPNRVAAWAAKMGQVTGVLIQVYKFKRLKSSWYDTRQLKIPDIVAEAGGFQVLDFVPWDKLNAPPSGNIKGRDHDAYEFILIAVKSEAYTYHKHRAEYADKTKKKAAAAGRPEYQIDLWGNDHALAADFRQADIEGQLSGGHAELNEEGAIQDNVWRISPTGDEKGRPRVDGGSFPLALARRAILQYSNPGDVIADPCGGSGTTMIEALRNGRSGVAAEIKQKNYDVLCNWMEAEAVKAGGANIKRIKL